MCEDFYKDKNLFDFSGYSQDSKFFDLVSKNVIGNMKDEFKGKISGEYVGLKWKMYSLIDMGGKEIKKQKESIKMLLTVMRHKEYLDVFLIKNDETQNDYSK